MERKIKSIQMFKRPTTKVKQGDRCGICVASLDSTLMERGIATSSKGNKSGYIVCFDSAICIVQKVKAYQGGHLSTDTKFHISVGHNTVMATIKFFGAQEIVSTYSSEQHLLHQQNTTINSPISTFNFDQDYLFQDRLIEKLSLLKRQTNVISCDEDKRLQQQEESLASMRLDDHDHYNVSTDYNSLWNWAIVQFHTPVFCPLHSLIIGSRLDIDANTGTSTADIATTNQDSTVNSTCRLAFHGRIIQKFDPKVDSARLKIYNWKEKKGTLQRLGDAYRRDVDQKIVRYEVYGSDLFKKETKMNQFVGMKLQTEDGGDIGVIRSSFGTEGKFKVYFPAGTAAKEGTKLILRFKRYTNDPKKGMHQDLVLPDALPGTKIETVKKSKAKKERNSKVTPSESSLRSSNDAEKDTVQTLNSTAATIAAPNNKLAKLGGGTNNESLVTPKYPSTGSIAVYGEISKYKQDSLMPDGQRYSVAIVDGFFTPDINIKEKVGLKVLVIDTNEEGVVSGSFGKMGKCKVSFEHGITAPEGSKVVLLE